MFSMFVGLRQHKKIVVVLFTHERDDTALETEGTYGTRSKSSCFGDHVLAVHPAKCVGGAVKGLLVPILGRRRIFETTSRSHINIYCWIQIAKTPLAVEADFGFEAKTFRSTPKEGHGPSKGTRNGTDCY